MKKNNFKLKKRNDKREHIGKSQTQMMQGWLSWLEPSREMATRESHIYQCMMGGKMRKSLLTSLVLQIYYFEDMKDGHKVKITKSRVKGSTLTWQKYMQDERVSMGKKPICNQNSMVTKVKENYLLEDYEIKFYRKRKGLKKRDLDMASYTQDISKVMPRVQDYRRGT